MVKMEGGSRQFCLQLDLARNNKVITNNIAQALVLFSDSDKTTYVILLHISQRASRYDAT